MTRTIGPDDLTALVQGARPFTTGINSSAIHVLQDWAADLVSSSTVGLRPLDECADDDTFAVCTVLGSPTALAENLPTGEEPARAMSALEKHLGRDIRGVLPINTAGENAVMAFIAAATADIDLVDADGCGRVFPRVEETMFTLRGIPLSPAVVVSPFGECTIIDAPLHRAASLVPQLVATSGGWAFFAGYPMTGAQLRASANPGTIGRFLRAAPGAPLAAVPHRVICRATITAVETPNRVSGSRISVLLRENRTPSRLIRIDADHEFFSVLGDGARLAASPDDILLIAEDGWVVEPDFCEVGMRVDVTVIDVPSPWHERSI